MSLLSFNQVIEACGHEPKHRPKLLIGNGFSIACCPDIFTYRSLLQEAKFDSLSKYSRTIFESLKTNDFELVIKGLLHAAHIAKHYETSDRKLIEGLENDAAGLKDQLAKTIALRHPDHPSLIEEIKYKRCREFLSLFQSIYSLNYDLLLYWTILHDEVGFEPVGSDDGFRRGDRGHQGYVTWDPLEAPTQNIHFMHGALHLFDKGSEFVKFTWNDTNIRLMDQIRAALDDGRFPRIVAEGTSNEKLDRIVHCAYLHKALRSLMSINGDLVIYGMSLMPNDDHILDAIVRGKTSRLFVGVFGDLTYPDNMALMERAQALIIERSTVKPRNPLEVFFFDSSTAKVWG